MDILIRPPKWYRRYRQENRYDSPLLIFVFDTLFSLVKAIIFLLVIATLVKFMFFGEQATKLHAGIANLPVTPLAVQSADSDYPETDYEAATTNLPNSLVAFDATADYNGNNKYNLKLVGEEWIDGLDPKAYIIQFGSSPDSGILEDLIPSINVGKPIAMYRFKNDLNSDPVYGIATGVYESLDKATAAIEYFPPEARTYDIWVRSVVLLKQSMVR